MSASSEDDKRVELPSTAAAAGPNVASPERRSFDNHQSESPAEGVPVNDTRKLRYIPRWLKWVTAAVTLVTGVLSTYAFKVMNRVAVPPCEGCTPRYFEGSFIQALTMFIGEALCYVLWLLDDYFSKRSNKFPFFDFVKGAAAQEPRLHGKWWWWSIPPLFDMIATVMMAIAMQITYGSTVQMLRNFMVIITAVCQVLIVRKALKVHQVAGVTVITVALVLSAIPAITDPESATNSEGGGKAALGVVLALVGTALQGIQVTFEELALRKSRIPPSRAVGISGIFGIIYTCIVMPIGDVTKLEAVWESWYQAGQSGIIVGWIIGYIFVAAAFNVFGLATTRLASGLLRSVIFAFRAPVVWVFDLILDWIEYNPYNLASVLVFLVGFAFYCRMFELPGGLGAFWRKPIHCCSYTDPALDADLAVREDEPVRTAEKERVASKEEEV